MNLKFIFPILGFLNFSYYNPYVEKFSGCFKNTLVCREISHPNQTIFERISEQNKKLHLKVGSTEICLVKIGTIDSIYVAGDVKAKNYQKLICSKKEFIMASGYKVYFENKYYYIATAFSVCDEPSSKLIN